MEYRSQSNRIYSLVNGEIEDLTKKDGYHPLRNLNFSTPKELFRFINDLERKLLRER
jgi:hypothetical protein